MRPEPKWVAQARELQEQGLSYRKIAAALDKHRNVVCYYLSPNHRAKALAGAKRWVASNPERHKELREICRLRALARVQAEETGEPVRAVYARWRCLTQKDFRS